MTPAPLCRPLCFCPPALSFFVHPRRGGPLAAICCSLRSPACRVTPPASALRGHIAVASSSSRGSEPAGGAGRLLLLRRLPLLHLHRLPVQLLEAGHALEHLRQGAGGGSSAAMWSSVGPSAQRVHPCPWRSAAQHARPPPPHPAATHSPAPTSTRYCARPPPSRHSLYSGLPTSSRSSSWARPPRRSTSPQSLMRLLEAYSTRRRAHFSTPACGRVGGGGELRGSALQQQPHLLLCIHGAWPLCSAHQAVHLVVGDPELLQRGAHRLEPRQVLQAVAPQAERLQRLQPCQVANLVQCVGGQRQVAARLERLQAGVHLLDRRAHAGEVHAVRRRGLDPCRRRPLGQRVLAGRRFGRHTAWCG